MTNFANKVVLVTGGGTGIGEAAARSMAAKGATVGIAGRRLDVLERLAEETGCIPLQCDVSDTQSVKTAVKALVDQAGALNIVVNNAAAPTQGQVGDLSDEEWEFAVDVNLNGVFRVCREAIPHLRDAGGGSIVNVASIGGLFSAPNVAPYATTKAAILGLTRSMAVDYGPYGIRVNTLCPCFVETPMLEPVLQAVANGYGISREEAPAKLTEILPLRRIASPQDAANCVEFLASDASACVTGTMLVADNGQTAMDVGFVQITAMAQQQG